MQESGYRRTISPEAVLAVPQGGKGEGPRRTEDVEANEEAEEAATGTSTDYDYLLGMAIWSHEREDTRGDARRHRHRAHPRGPRSPPRPVLFQHRHRYAALKPTGLRPPRSPSSRASLVPPRLPHLPLPPQVPRTSRTCSTSMERQHAVTDPIYFDYIISIPLLYYPIRYYVNSSLLSAGTRILYPNIARLAQDILSMLPRARDRTPSLLPP